MFLDRHLFRYISSIRNQFKVLLITGPRQVGKSTLLKETLTPKYSYVVLDDFAELDLAQKDPALFFKNHPFPLIVDEVQYAPSLFREAKLLADSTQKKGILILTGSQGYQLLKKASDSLAGRICLIDMTSLSMREKVQCQFYTEFLPDKEYITKRSKKIATYGDVWESIFRGSMPELIDKSIDWESFYRSYLRTYIERDVAELINVKNMLKFNSFMRCLAARTGSLFNADSIAGDIGVTSKTIQEWTSILESSGIIKILRPYEKSLSNRSIKTPKIYFMDTGLVCYLVGWTSSQVAKNGAMSGALFETFVVSEIFKSYSNNGKDSSRIYFYRDRQGKEIDLVIEKDGDVYPIEIKKTATPTIDMTKNFSVLSKADSTKMKAGCIICSAEKKFLLGENIYALPIEYI